MCVCVCVCVCICVCVCVCMYVCVCVYICVCLLVKRIADRLAKTFTDFIQNANNQHKVIGT